MNEKYAVLYREPQNEFNSKDTLAFFETKEEMEKLITDLHSVLTKTNQPFSEFASVFPKGALYPTEYEAFWNETRNKARTSYNVGASYFVQYRTKTNILKQFYFDFAEDFDWKMEEWIEKSYHSIYILNTSEALQGDYYYACDIQKYWGSKDEPLIA